MARTEVGAEAGFRTGSAFIFPGSESNFYKESGQANSYHPLSSLHWACIRVMAEKLEILLVEDYAADVVLFLLDPNRHRVTTPASIFV